MSGEYLYKMEFVTSDINLVNKVIDHLASLQEAEQSTNMNSVVGLTTISLRGGGGGRGGIVDGNIVNNNDKANVPDGHVLIIGHEGPFPDKGNAGGDATGTGRDAGSDDEIFKIHSYTVNTQFLITKTNEGT